MKLTLLLVVFLLASSLWAADPPAKVAPLDDRFLRDYAETRGFMLGRPVKARPTPDGKAVLFLRSEPRKPKLALFEFDVASGKTRELLTPEAVLKGAEEQLTPEEKARRERQRVSVGGFTDYQLSEDGRSILLPLSGKLYVYDRPAATVRELTTGAGTLVDPKFSPDGKSIAYVRDYDVFVFDLAAGKERPVTTGGTATKTNGLAEFVAQEEMDRFTGYWWSPDSKFIAYEEADASAVETWYVADPINPSQKPHATAYPRPGKANVQVRVGIVPVAGGQTVWIDWDRKKYEYLAQVRWDRHGPLTLQVQDRKQQELVVLRVDPATGKTTSLVTEKDPAWVNIEPDAPRWLPGEEGFLWTRDTESGRQLDLRAPTGQLRRELYERINPFSRLVDVDTKGQRVADETYFPHDEPLQSVGLFSLADAKHKLAFVLRPGLSTMTVSRSFDVVVVTQTDATRMPRSEVYRSDQVPLGILPSVAEDPGFTPQVAFMKLNGEIDFQAAVVRPHGSVPTRKYPVILDVYGGPHHRHVVPAMRNLLLRQWLADQGFVVVAIDNRGTPGRGRDWERAIYQKFASVPLDDQVRGLQALAQKHPEMDLTRVGIYGWSFGGYMSALAVLKRPDVFKAAVAGAPVTDWEDYDTHYTERYLGLPQESPQAYKEASLLTYAADLKRPLLLVHGTADDNVYFRHTLKLSDALFRAGKDFEVLPLSGLTHMVPDPVVTQRLYGRIAGFFKKHLGEPQAK